MYDDLSSEYYIPKLLVELVLAVLKTVNIDTNMLSEETKEYLIELISRTALELDQELNKSFNELLGYTDYNK